MNTFRADFDSITDRLHDANCVIIQDLENGQYRFNYWPKTGGQYMAQSAVASALCEDAVKALVDLGIGGSYCTPAELKLRITVEFSYGTFVLNFHSDIKVLKITFVSADITE